MRGTVAFWNYRHRADSVFTIGYNPKQLRKFIILYFRPKLRRTELETRFPWALATHRVRLLACAGAGTRRTSDWSNNGKNIGKRSSTTRHNCTYIKILGRAESQCGNLRQTWRTHVDV